jgi:PKD repeat protein
LRRTLLSVFCFLCLAVYGCSRTEDSTSTNLNQPKITGINPGSVHPGQTDVEGRIFGSNFVGVQAVNLGPGVDVHQFQALSATELYIFFSVQPEAAPGPRNIIVSNGAGAGNFENGFSVGNNRVPKAVFSFSPFIVYKDKIIRFDGSKSSDDNGISKYKWEFGDGTQTSGRVVTHKYKRHGNFQVRLTVTDNENLSSEAWRNLDVDASQAPIVQFTVSPPTGDVSTQFRFDASGTRDPDGKITRFQWAFGDGSFGSGESVTHQFQTAGNHPVTLNVTDNSGVHNFSTRFAFVTGGTTPGPGPIPPAQGSSAAHRL